MTIYTHTRRSSCFTAPWLFRLVHRKQRQYVHELTAVVVSQ